MISRSKLALSLSLSLSLLTFLHKHVLEVPIIAAGSTRRIWANTQIAFKPERRVLYS